MTPQTRSFMARFAKISFERIAAARADDPDLGAVARELHSMAGEAGLLGVVEVMALARAAEQAAVELMASRTDEHRQSFACALADLEIALSGATRSVFELESKTP
jgi:HPt (histidine-containing phosphotransfer) domain-containing protein